MSLQILVPIIAALAGAGLAAFAGELRHYVESSRDRRKALNRVLWCQLDLWYEVKRADIGDGLDIVFSKLATRLGVDIAAIASVETRSKLAQILADNFALRKSLELDKKYADAVETLAAYEPVLAYQLSGKTDLQRHREKSDAYVSAIAEQFGEGKTVDSAGLGALMPFAREETFRAADLVLQEDIEDVAARLGPEKMSREAFAVWQSVSDRINESGSMKV
jgi:hypothetical protein